MNIRKIYSRSILTGLFPLYITFQKSIMTPGDTIRFAICIKSRLHKNKNKKNKNEINILINVIRSIKHYYILF